jgi:hypothetical protein
MRKFFIIFVAILLLHPVIGYFYLEFLEYFLDCKIGLKKNYCPNPILEGTGGYFYLWVFSLNFLPVKIVYGFLAFMTLLLMLPLLRKNNEI